MAFQHVVLFRFPEPPTAEDDSYVRSSVTSWADQIGGFRLLRIGTDTSCRAQGWHYCLVEEFDSVADFRRYVDHPVHQVFVRWVAERQIVTLAFDYEV